MLEWAKKNVKNIVVFGGPIIFEISNEITGNWTDASGKINIEIGKFVTILIGITYFVVLSYLTYKENKVGEEIDVLKEEITDLKTQNGIFDKNVKSVCNILGYTTEKTKNQITYYKSNKEIDMSYVNATNAATIVCESIYESIIALSEEKRAITVNYYTKYVGADEKMYSEMIAHEGYNTTPKYYLIPKLLKMDKKAYFCERLLNNNNPDIVFLTSKHEIAKAFGVAEEKCKYNQYIGIPIRRFASDDNVALIEIVAHNDSVIWNDIEEVKDFVKLHCNIFSEYMLLVDMLTNLHGTVNKYQKEEIWGQNYERNSEISQGR